MSAEDENCYTKNLTENQKQFLLGLADLMEKHNVYIEQEYVYPVEFGHEEHDMFYSGIHHYKGLRLWVKTN